MAYILEKIGNTYNIPKQFFVCDRVQDLGDIDLTNVSMGSEIHCIQDAKIFVLGSDKKWYDKNTGQVFQVV